MVLFPGPFIFVHVPFIYSLGQDDEVEEARNEVGDKMRGPMTELEGAEFGRRQRGRWVEKLSIDR
jgi:hypothetical protein